MPQDIIQAIETRAWYPLAAMLITAAIALWRRVAPQIFERIPARWQWLPAVLLNAGAAFVEASQSGLAWSVALVMAVYAAMVGGTVSVGTHRIAKESAKQ